MPLVATGPRQPPLAVHAVASVAVQVNVELLRLLIVVGEAARATEGAGWVTATSADCATEPPAPVQVSV